MATVALTVVNSGAASVDEVQASPWNREAKGERERLGRSKT